MDKPDWQPFFTDLEERRAKLLAACSLPLDTLKEDYPFLGVLPDRRFESRESLRDALAGAPVEFLTGVARGGSPA